MDSVSLGERKQLGQAIRAWREQAGLSQRGLGHRLGTSQSAVSRWENGRDEPRLSTLGAILRECGLRGSIQVGEGVDRAQLREQLAMTPRQRLEALANVSRMASQAQKAG